MKNFLVVFSACLAAVVVGFLVYEWYQDYEMRQEQWYRSAAYLGQGLVLADQVKVGVAEVLQYNGELPCTNDDFRAIGLALPDSGSTSQLPQIDVTGCGEITLTYRAFDGTPAGRIVFRATRREASTSVGPPLSWVCTTPHYREIESYFPQCEFVAGNAENLDSTATGGPASASDDAVGSCGTDVALYRTAFAGTVENRTPQHRLVTVGPDAETVFFFTEIVGASGKQVSHRWFHNGIPLATVPFDVRGDRWRTWSSKTLGAIRTGTLRVEVHDGDCLIGQESIEVSDTELAVSPLYGPMSPYQAVEATLAHFESGGRSDASVVTMTPVGELYRFDDGDTPLHRAIRTGNRAAIYALLDAALRDHSRDIPRGLQILYDYDAGGRQPVDIARDLGMRDILDRLEPLIALSWPDWAVSRATFAMRVTDGEPVECRDEAYDDERTLAFFAELTDMAGRRVNHEWVYQGETVQTNSFEVGSQRWSTQSARQFAPDDVGQWHVNVTTADGKLIHRENLRYDKLTETNEGRRESYRRFPCNTGTVTLLPLALAYAPVARLDYLVEKGARLQDRMGPLATVAVEGRNVSLLRWLLGRGLDIDDNIDTDDSSLTLAAKNGDVNMVLFLLRQGADVDRIPRFSHLSPLGAAARYDHPQVVRILLEHGAEPNGSNTGSGTALQSAVRQCNHESTRLLLEYGAAAELADKQSNGPAAAAKKCVEKGAWTEDLPEYLRLIGTPALEETR